MMRKLILLTMTSLFVFHIQMVNAQDNTNTVKTTSGNEECVIRADDQ